MKKKKIILFIIALAFVLTLFFFIFKTSDKKFENSVDATPLQDITPTKTDILRRDTVASKDYLMGKFDPAKMENFVSVAKNYAIPGFAGLYLRKETFDAFVKMSDEAKKDGVTLKIISATRNFDTQKGIWNTKWEKYHDIKQVLTYSAMPGTSRHHWGTDMDINSVDLAYFNTEKGKKEYEWLSKNAKTFGFCQPYSAKSTDRKTGHSEEKWHWSYIPLSKTFTQDFKNRIKQSDLIGFSGVEKISEVNIIDEYVLGINPECL